MDVRKSNYMRGRPGSLYKRTVCQGIRINVEVCRGVHIDVLNDEKHISTSWMAGNQAVYTRPGGGQGLHIDELNAEKYMWTS